jgi:hypothetical protein
MRPSVAVSPRFGSHSGRRRLSSHRPRALPARLCRALLFVSILQSHLIFSTRAAAQTYPCRKPVYKNEPAQIREAQIRFAPNDIRGAAERTGMIRRS